MRKINPSPKELKAILKEHKLWLESGGTQGTCADFRNAKLRGADLGFSDLRGVDFRNADLRNVSCFRTNLHGAKLDAGILGVDLIWDAHFSSDALPLLMLRPRWAEERGRVQISDE
jgi:hypothetical protein